MKKLLSIVCFIAAFSVDAQSISQDYSVLRNANLSNDHTVDGERSILNAVRRAGFAKQLESEGPFTLLVPTESAITNLPDEYRFRSLLKPENKEKLVGIVAHHLIKGKFKANDLMKLIEENNGKVTVESIKGDELVLSLSYGKIKIKDQQGNTTTVINKDINSSNGVIHIIDNVLIPFK